MSYLVGVGQADTQDAASDRAYASVARIFKADVAAQAKDWESYLTVDRRGSSYTERRLVLDHVTKVSTDKILENVRIVDAWYDRRTKVHYALAVMYRPQAEASLRDRVTTLDHAIEADIHDARQSTDTLARVRGLRRAARNLVLREAYNGDLRIVNPSGEGLTAAYRLHDLLQELDRFLATNLMVVVEARGDHAEPAQRALTEGLVREGLPVMSDGGGDGRFPDMVVRVLVQAWPIKVRDPHFQYVRWCSEVEVVEVTTQRVLGTMSRGGKEGHLTDREATAKALRVMEQTLSSEAAQTMAAFIYGDAVSPSPPGSASGCPREDVSANPGQ